MRNILHKIETFFQERYERDISIYAESFLDTTINERVVATASKTADDYLALLESNKDEASLLLDSLTNAYSEFFRNPLTFALLEQFVLPKLTNENSKLPSGEIRVWSAGCSAGQEPYSLAMLIEHFKTTHLINSRFRIFATDISTKQIEIARQGFYDVKALQNTRMRFIKKYFEESKNGFLLDDKIKKQVDFSLFDLLNNGSSAPPASIFGDFDLIMCSNVLFYYRPEIRKMILSKFHRSLKSDGFFITGEAEVSVVKSFGKFRQFASPAPIFTKS